MKKYKNYNKMRMNKIKVNHRKQKNIKGIKNYSNINRSKDTTIKKKSLKQKGKTNKRNSLANLKNKMRSLSQNKPKKKRQKVNTENKFKSSFKVCQITHPYSKPDCLLTMSLFILVLYSE